tara:strand:+ start:474 stop:1202 length:729 start_codon:yes stop_codon:yes gene_type:complete
MRICVSGTGSQGKSTFIKDFLEEWSNYSTPDKTYRDFLKRTHSKKTTKDIQWKILNSMIDELHKHDEKANVIFDRGPLDNIVYTLWAHSKGVGKVDEKFVDKCITLVRECLKHLDIVFYIPITRAAAPVQYDTEDFQKDMKKGLTDHTYREEIDNLFKALKREWDTNPDSKFFDPRDKPAVIEIFGEPLERIQIAKLYLDIDGDPVDSVGIMTEDDLNQIEDIKRQFGITDKQSQAYKKPQG